MTRYDDFWVKMPKRFQKALATCGTDRFLARTGGIVDEFHKGVRAYDGSSDEQFREAYLRATKAMAPRLLVPFTSMKPTDAAYQDHLEFFQRHLDCLRAYGLSDGEVVDAVAAQACIVLQERGASP
jgi:hypothetical protein